LQPSLRRRRPSIRAEAFESLARLAGVLSLLATWKIGRGSASHRWRQRRARIAEDDAPRSSRGWASPARGRSRETRSPRLSLHSIVAVAWIALSLIVLAYAAIAGERALAEFDGYDLVTLYSSLPLIQP